jgi:thiamine biosynthesis lipoprotein
MRSLEAMLSRHRDDSEVGRLNATGRVDGASDALLDVLRLADRIHRLGDGAFDVTVLPVLELYRRTPSGHHALPAKLLVEQALAAVGQHRLRIDGRTVSAEPGVRVTLDGIAKGYVVDQAVAELKALGFPNTFVEAGGDLIAAGEKAGGAPWRIGIRNPRPGLTLVARFDVRERAVATSGDYMQPFTPDFALHHILDPRTGRSAPELASATVIASDAATADALATLTMVLGSARGRALLEELPGCEGYFVAKDLTVTRTTGFTTV